MNTRGVCTLPARLRTLLGLKEGDLMEFEVIRVFRPETTASNTEATDESAPAREGAFA